MIMYTLHFHNIDAKLVSLFEHTLAASSDEVVEAISEGSHMRAQLIEAEVHGWKGVGH